MNNNELLDFIVRLQIILEDSVDIRVEVRGLIRNKMKELKNHE